MALDQTDFRKHRILILETKLEILKKLSKGESGASLAKQYGVSKSTVSEIKRKGDILLQYASTIKSEDGLKRRKTLRMASNTALEEEVYRWFTERRQAGDPVSGPLICEKALKINEELGGSSEFKASSGWLKNFKTRHNIKMQDLIIADVTARVAKNRLKERGEDYRSEDNGAGESSTMGNSVREMHCTDSVVNGCPVRIKTEVNTSDSEMDSQYMSELWKDRTNQSKASLNTEDVEKGYTVSFPTVTTILQPQDQQNSDDTDEENTCGKMDHTSAPVNVKEEVDVSDVENDVAEEDPTGPSDNDALIALDTAIDWLERQADKIQSHLSTLRKIRDFAIYKERLRSLTRGPNALNP